MCSRNGRWRITVALPSALSLVAYEVCARAVAAQRALQPESAKDHQQRQRSQPEAWAHRVPTLRSASLFPLDSGSFDVASRVKDDAIGPREMLRRLLDGGGLKMTPLPSAA